LITQAQPPQSSSLERSIGLWRWDALAGAPVLVQEIRAANLVGVRPDLQWLLAGELGPAAAERVAAYPLLIDSAQLRQDVIASCLLARPLSEAQRQAFLIGGR
jgi:hypothetical protein